MCVCVCVRAFTQITKHDNYHFILCTKINTIFFPFLFPAERSELVGSLSEGDPSSASAHHDHDEDGSHCSGQSTQTTIL